MISPSVEIMWKNIVELGRPQMMIEYGACTTYIAGWINKVANTHLEYFILIAFQYNDGYANAPEYYVIRTLPVLCTSVLPCVGKNLEKPVQ
jgi:hypothetical protein